MESRTIRYGVTAFTALLLAFSGSDRLLAQVRDPGVRPGDAGAGGPLPTLPDALQKLFDAGKDVFEDTEKVVEDGLGPRINLDSCKGCHAQPAIGGSSPKENPQVALFDPPVDPEGNQLDRTTNKQPSFISKDGPVREARFKQIFENGRPVGPDGGVHDLFTIAGMKGAKECKLDQPKFEEELGQHNVIFRIPTPVFGAGLIEQIPDQAIIENIDKDAARKDELKISRKLNVVLSGGAITAQNTKKEQPRPNKNGNDGTIARFGWKAQNKSLLIFSGEAYNVEMGISNELFQTEREESDPVHCQPTPKGTPNDKTEPSEDGLKILSDMEKFASFMRLLAPPERSNNVKDATPDSIVNGGKLFNQVGCALCHTQTLMTGKSPITPLNEQPVNLFSDLALHHMGAKLDDGITQGQAERDEFRTAPLWGLGKRIWFLHDGRTSDLVEAIEEHSSPATIGYRCWFLWKFFSQLFCGPDDGTIASEADAVVDQYNGLSDNDKQDLLNFLRSL